MGRSARNNLGPKEGDLVRVRLARGVWQLVPTEQRTTLARYVILSDLGGQLRLDSITDTVRPR
jgi:hypothetical protein